MRKTDNPGNSPRCDQYLFDSVTSVEDLQDLITSLKNIRITQINSLPPKAQKKLSHLLMKTAFNKTWENFFNQTHSLVNEIKCLHSRAIASLKDYKIRQLHRAIHALEIYGTQLPQPAPSATVSVPQLAVLDSPGAIAIWHAQQIREQVDYLLLMPRETAPQLKAWVHEKQELRKRLNHANRDMADHRKAESLPAKISHIMSRINTFVNRLFGIKESRHVQPVSFFSTIPTKRQQHLKAIRQSASKTHHTDRRSWFTQFQISI